MSGETLSINVADRVQTADKLLGGDGITRYVKNGTIYSVYPPTAHLTFANWIYMVPPYKPKSVLMLGYAGGTTAGLIQKLHGADTPITGVDLHIVDNRYGVELIQADARDFVRTTDRRFDAVLIDLFDEQQSPPFVCDEDFIEQVARITENFLVVHASPEVDLSAYEYHFTKLRRMDFGHQLVYFKTPNNPSHYFAL